MLLLEKKGHFYGMQLRGRVSVRYAGSSKWEPIFTENVDGEETYLKEHHHFFECIQNQHAPLVGIAQGLRVMEVIDAVRQSSNQQQSVEGFVSAFGKNYVALICARDGSKGIKSKNLQYVGEHTLVGWSIHAAMQIDRLSQVLVSTDSARIASVAREYGANVPFLRPAALATDSSPEWLVWRHALEHLSESTTPVDGLVVIPPTAPLRHPNDIEQCIDLFEQSDSDVVLTVTTANRSPYFNMVKSTGPSEVGLVIPPDKEIVRRQDVPEVFDITTVAYVAKPEYVMHAGGIFEGKVGSVFVPPERAIDIDTAMDLMFAQTLYASLDGAIQCAA